MKTISSVTNTVRFIASASLLVLLASIVPDASAVVVKNLYDVEFQVPNQNSQVRTAVFSKGLEEVLVRVSGSRSVLQGIKPGRASSYVQKFSYVQDQADEKMAGVSKSITTKSGSDWYTLKIQYNAGKIISLLRDNGLPVWGEHRSETVVWMAVRDGSNRYVLKRSDASLLKNSVELSLNRRGLPAIWPINDRKDQQQLPFADVWAAFGGPVKAASKRYAKGPAIVGRLSWTGSEWKGDWALFVENSAYSWSLSGSDYNTVIAEGIDLSADMIGKHDAVLERAGITEPDLLVEINNVDSVQTYRKVQKFLEGLTAVRQTSVARVDEGKVVFRIVLRGDINDFIRLVSTDKTFQPIAGSAQPGAGTVQPGAGSVQPGAGSVQQTLLRYSYRK